LCDDERSDDEPQRRCIHKEDRGGRDHERKQNEGDDLRAE
jgi:hypothetical protein